MQLFNLINKIQRKISWIIEDTLYFFCKTFYFTKKCNFIEESLFTIGITTFLNRYDNCFKPLLKKLTYLFPNTQIIVIANGHMMKKDQIVYLEKIEKFCARYKNVELMSFVEPKGLSYLWNKILLRSRGDSVLLLNDDVNIKMKFQDLVIKSGILSYPITTINSSWSHFIISKVIFNKIGPFDEGLKEIGGEDDDYAARLAMMGRTIKDFSTKAIARKLRRKRRLLKCNSYGKDMNLERFGYSNLNSEYLAKKWETGMEYFDGAVMVPNRSIRYWKLRKKWSSN